VALSQTRRHYKELMQRAATAPGATLGQRIYTARRIADLSVQEAANGVGLRADLLAAIEAGEPTTQDEANKVKALIAALDG
jgi:ribosome-binding protein aMBF1 (putative translation factor)